MLTFFSDMMGAMRKLPTWVFFWVNVVLSPAVIVAFVLAVVHPHPVFTWAGVLNVVGVGPNFVML